MRIKPRRVSRAPEWSERAYWHPSLDCYVHGLEVWHDLRRARLHVAGGGAAPEPKRMATVMNMLAPDVGFVDVVDQDGRTVLLMANAERWWRSGEPLEAHIEPMPHGVFVRLPAIVGKPQHAGPLVRRADRMGTERQEAAA